MEKNWHPEFLKYMDYIVNHPSYNGLAIKKNPDGSYGWIATAKSEIGEKRIEWCLAKAKELRIPIQAGVYADVMLAIHPTKWKVCQICGKQMSLYYLYPNENFLRALNKKFDSNFTTCDYIVDIWDSIKNKGYSEKEIATFFVSKGDLHLPITASKEEIIREMEIACRKGTKKCLGPGAMSNFPDRFDGFHTYNRCCRSTQDTGRSKENLKSYTKDRRAYEYWSDGNIHAANQFMGSPYFEGASADHVGPISLGFVHDPRYLRKMSGSDNSSKRDRLQVVDIEEIILTYNRTNVYPMSWYSKIIWEYIKDNYKNNRSLVEPSYRNMLKQNMSNYMYVLNSILLQAGEKGKQFLVDRLLKPKYEYFKYSYTFNELGVITSSTERHYTDRLANEFDRYVRIAIESVYDFNNKDNRNLKNDLTYNEKIKLDRLCVMIVSGRSDTALFLLKTLMETIQNRIVNSL